MAGRSMFAICTRSAESCLCAILRALVKFARAAVVGPTFTFSHKA
jgi:hypothetical protein